ncbi:MAG: multicopper oxidase domain-containing protein [Microcoleaceae cyanobacterium MO_207.B10]|nr:multicopper oxidase domain-containing protein [Microcoleaceae cyanobacterium MO_207.B10]
MKRREFIALTTSTTAAIFLSKYADGQSEVKSSSPERYISSNGLLDISLNVAAGRVLVGGQEANLFSYNGRIPGPMLEVRAGDQVLIHFTNNLPQPTNLHYQSLHIHPTGNADNVFLEIPPRESFTYEFSIPKNHRAGTFLYHPHLHGLVADQVFGGLAGLFVVRGELDNIPEVREAEEKFLVLQDFDIGAGMYPGMSMMFGREWQLVTVNGQVNPS